MRVERIWLHPFGRFADLTVGLAPGLNVVHGPNEAGKSTLHQALLTAVGGVRRGSGRHTEIEELRRRYRPWDGEGWRVGAVVVLAGGTRIELTRNLDRSDGSRVIELGTGRDRAGEVTVDGAPDGWSWLGLTRATYPATASVRQADVLAVGASGKLLAEHLQRAADAAGTDATAARALKRIEDYQKEHVGSTAKSSVRPWRRAADAEEEARRRLDEARRAHDDYLRLAAEARRLDALAAERARQQRAAEAALAAQRVRDLGAELQRIDELRAKHPAPPADLSRDDRRAQAAASALDGWRRVRDLPALDGPTAAELRARLASLPPAPQGETDPHPAVRRAAEVLAAATHSRRVHEARRPAEPPPLPTHVPADRLQNLARAFEGAPATTEQHGWAGRAAPILAAAVLAALLGAGLAVGLRSPVWLLGVALAAVLGVVAWTHGHALPPDLLLRRERLREAAAEAEGSGLPHDARALRALADQVSERREAERALERWHQDRAAHDAAERLAREDLRVELAARGASDLETYEAQCEARRRASAEAALREPLEARLGDRVELEAEHARALADRESAVRALRDAAAGLPGVAPEADEAPAALATRIEAWLRSRERRLADDQRALAEWAELQALLQAGAREDRAAELDEAEAEARALAAGVSADDLARAMARRDSPARVRVLAEEASAARRQADHARGQLDQHPARRLDVAEAQEALDRAAAERRRIEGLSQALTLARDYLKGAQERVHRDLAPVLARTLASWLPEITAGRYVDANVDPATLSVTVCGPDRDWRQADLLSRGTQEQIYLLLRLALVEHLTRKGESAPLLLDEVTVHSDDARTEALLSLLHRFAETHQVIVFTQERAVLEWSRGALHPERDRLIELAAVDAPAFSGAARPTPF